MRGTWGSGGGAGGSSGGAAEEGNAWGILDLPEGVDEGMYEEARMLEAAMLGVPYEGRMPDFSNRCVLCCACAVLCGTRE